MDDEDFNELVSMKRRGEPDEKILKVFQVLRYSRKEIMRNILKAESIIADEPEEKEKEGKAYEHILKFHDFHPNAPIIVLFICLFVICFSMLIWLDPLNRFDVELNSGQYRAPIYAQVISCSEGTVVLQVENQGNVFISQVEFYADGAKCEPTFDLNSGQRKLISCTGDFEKGVQYVLRSEDTYPEGFRC